MRLLKQVPSFVWIIVTALCIAELLFWPWLLQMDSMFFQIGACGGKSGWQRAAEWLWIPELGLSYKNCWILFFNLVVIGFHIPIVIIIWLLAEQLRLSSRIRNVLIAFLLCTIGYGYLPTGHSTYLGYLCLTAAFFFVLGTVYSMAKS